MKAGLVASLVVTILCGIVSIGQAARKDSPTCQGLWKDSWDYGWLHMENTSETKYGAKYLIDLVTNCASPGKCVAFPRWMTWVLSFAVGLDAKITDEHTFRTFLDLNHVNYDTCSKKTLKRRVNFCRGLDQGEPMSLTRNLYTYCRDSYQSLAEFCSCYQDDVYEFGINDRDYIRELSQAAIENSRYRYDVTSGNIENAPDILGDFIINN